MRDNADRDENVISMQRNKASIRDVITQSDGEAAERTPHGDLPPEEPQAQPETARGILPALDDVSPLPGAGDAYKAYARIANKPLTTLVLLGNTSARGFSYANLDTLDLLPSSDTGQGPVIALRFSGIAATEILLSGRNLDALYVSLGAHRIAWIRERSQAREFLATAESVITAITISKLEG
jgi:hypothetical protein